jgi:DNA repair protein RadC
MIVEIKQARQSIENLGQRYANLSVIVKDAANRDSLEICQYEMKKSDGTFASYDDIMRLARDMSLERDRLKQSTAVIDSAQKAAKILYDRFIGLDHEQLHVMYLDTSNKLIATVIESVGGKNTSTIYSEKIARHALMYNASAVIIAHNHPSSNLNPSDADKQITKKIMKTLEILNVVLLDHIIINETATDFHSAKEHNWL